MGTVRRIIRITTMVHKTTGAMIAESPDLPGLMVPGRTVGELETRIPVSIREILEHLGLSVVSVSAESEESHSGFVEPRIKATAEVRHTA
jgi:hypothetical protein